MSVVDDGRIQDTGLPITNPTDSIDVRVNEYFANYFQTNPQVDENQYEQVKSFFDNITSNDEATAALTAAIIQVADDLEIYVQDILEQFSQTTDLKTAIPYLLNLSRRGSSLLGYETGWNQSPNIKRQVEI